jgi:hypothetical protein
MLGKTGKILSTGLCDFGGNKCTLRLLEMDEEVNLKDI